MELEEIYEIIHERGTFLARLGIPSAEAYLEAARLIKLSIDNPAAQLIKLTIAMPAVNNRCPNCHRQLRKPITPQTLMSGRKISRQGDNFCPRCGQKIKWRET